MKESADGATRATGSIEKSLSATNTTTTDAVAAPTVRPGVKSKSAESLVFSTPASYQIWVCLLLAIAPVVLIASAISTWNDASESHEEKVKALVTLACSMLFVLTIYVFVFPRRFEVHADASIRVVTWPLSYRFGHVIAAYEKPAYFSLRPRVKFETDLSKRVLVRRKMRGWDITVSPEDVQGFVKAVWQVAEEVEADE